MKSALTLLALLASLSSFAAITIGSYNIRNFDYDERYRIRTNKPQLASMLKSLKADVLSVEEINNVAEFQAFIPASLPGYQSALSQCGGEHGQHLGFIYNTATVQLLSFNEDLAMSGQGGGCNSGSRPAAIGLFQVKATGQKFFGITLHLKSGSNNQSLGRRSQQFDTLKKLIRELSSKTGINDFFFAGDMNTTEYVNRGCDYKMFTKLVSELGMIDLASNLKCSAYWWGGTDDGVEEPTLLDHVVVTPGLLKTKNQAQAFGHCAQVSCRSAKLGELGISYESVSDHCPLAAVIQ